MAGLAGEDGNPTHESTADAEDVDMHGKASLVEHPPVRSAAENEVDGPDHAQRRLQADVYASFNSLYEGDKEKEAACWEQARRHFYDIQADIQCEPPKRARPSARAAPDRSWTSFVSSCTTSSREHRRSRR
ncbi:MAG: IS66 family transposase, partial [Burkholderiales bacterium]|nr:IS66 family transposase [Burkholderiales bacterium]